MTYSRRVLFLALASALAFQAHAADNNDAPPPKTQDLDAVSVIGQGETRQVQRIVPDDQKVLPPGTSPQKILNRLPGVSVQSNDAFGANEESQTITLRGFNATRLGYTLDGLPLGDNAYGNYNGLNISRALIAENMSTVELSEGIGALGTASTSNLGGAIQYFSSDPAKTFGGKVAQTFGSDHNRRTYARIDTGDYKGFSMYLSGVKANADMWAQPHSDTGTKQFNGKAVYEFGDGNRITGFADTSRTSQADYAYLSKSGMQRGLGWDWNLYAPDWNRALAAAYCSPAYTKGAVKDSRCGFSGGVDNIDDAYFQSRALRRDDLYYIAGDFTVADGATLHTQVYHHENGGQGHWWAPGQKSYPGTAQELPISIRSTNYTINRNGAIASLAWDLGNHHVEGCIWYEKNDHHVERNFYYITGPVSDDRYLSNPDRRLFSQDYTITTKQAYIQDTFKALDDRLTVDVGVKSPHTTMTAREVPGVAVEGPLANGTLKASKSFLPQVGLAYQVAPGQEFFLSYAKNIAAFQGGGASGPLLVTQAAFDQTKSSLRPEESRTIDGGFRSIGDWYEASVALYDVKFNNRLLSLNPCPSIEQNTRPGCYTAFVNVGSVSSQGAEFTFIWKPFHGFQWYNSASFNKSTYDDNYSANGVVVPVKNKTTVDTPKRLFSSVISYTYGPWSASLEGKYTGKRYYTYTNDQSVAGATSFDFGAAYNFGQVGQLKALTLALNITNLTDHRYASNLTAFGATDPQGRALAFHASAPRQSFVTLSADF
ncbi:MAG: Vitamin B12 transporter BtuB [Luteibacter sp.]|uniref:TonB-dependent receptor n=1 Tax=Luteibacter sp. TaxID=1886636 RepID=UPI00138316B9|nr:TonB-dependent receptor [Luteibacter sp.]KAF1005633.1 MAG: Vitamin B12 transporter BtuB [Luteibacter sp.]